MNQRDIFEIESGLTPNVELTTDRQQLAFKEYKVPDLIRIAKVESFLVRYFKNSLSGLRVLELGVAKGGLAERLKNYGSCCFGIDICSRYIEGIKIIQHNLNHGIPEFDEGFDIIFAGEIIEHVFDDVALVRSCHLRLKTNGLLILTTPNLAFLVNRFRILFGKMPLFAYAPYHYHIYNIAMMHELLQENGFEVIKTTASHLLFSTRRHKIGRIFEILADVWPSLGAHIILFSRKR